MNRAFVLTAVLFVHTTMAFGFQGDSRRYCSPNVPLCFMLPDEYKVEELRFERHSLALPQSTYLIVRSNIDNARDIVVSVDLIQDEELLSARNAGRWVRSRNPHLPHAAAHAPLSVTHVGGRSALARRIDPALRRYSGHEVFLVHGKYGYRFAALDKPQLMSAFRRILMTAEFGDRPLVAHHPIREPGSQGTKAPGSAPPSSAPRESPGADLSLSRAFCKYDYV